MKPLVSVMIVVMGAAEHLEEALVSLLRQTLQDFEIIIVSGGLHEPAQRMLDRYCTEYAHIKLFPQEKPGIAAARTQAMNLASGKYCAVNDADDISLPHRLENQVNFLETNPEVDLCGAWIQTIGAGPSQIRRLPISDAEIRSQMMFICPFAHSTVMWRRESVANNGQQYELESSEDYDLWAKLLPHLNFANLPEVLVHYRLHEGQRSNYVEETDQNWAYQLQVRTSLIRFLGVDPTGEEAHLHQKMFVGRNNEIWIDAAEQWLLKLRDVNRERQIFPVEAFDRVIATHWWNAALFAKAKHFRLGYFVNSPITSDAYSRISSKIIALIRFAKQLLGKHVKRFLV